MNERDVELEQRYVAPTKGFQSVVAKITSDEDKTTTIYRRFDKLSARNLLFYQAELAELQALQDQYDEEDRKAVDEISRECQRDWTTFVAEARADPGADEVKIRQKKKMDLAIKIREVLERYHSALASHKELLNAVPPSTSTVRAFRNWFFDNTAGIKGGERTPQLWGASAQSYDDIHDLVALRVPADQDRLSEFIQNNFGIFFQTSTPDNRTTYISERKVSRFVAVLSTILAAILLLGAIISLYIVKNQIALLGMLSGWTVLFAACVGLLTNARRDQIFGATAAYAAVLVVFVSGNLGSAPTAGGSG